MEVSSSSVPSSTSMGVERVSITPIVQVAVFFFVVMWFGGEECTSTSCTVSKLEGELEEKRDESDLEYPQSLYQPHSTSLCGRTPLAASSQPSNGPRRVRQDSSPTPTRSRTDIH